MAVGDGAVVHPDQTADTLAAAGYRPACVDATDTTVVVTHQPANLEATGDGCRAVAADDRAAVVAANQPANRVAPPLYAACRVAVGDTAVVVTDQTTDIGAGAGTGHRTFGVTVADGPVVDPNQCADVTVTGDAYVGQAEIAQGAAGRKHVDETYVAAGGPVAREVVQHVPSAIESRGRERGEVPARQGGEVEIAGQAELIPRAVGET